MARLDKSCKAVSVRTRSNSSEIPHSKLVAPPTNATLLPHNFPTFSLIFLPHCQSFRCNCRS
ncbi:hypothetical protein Leryth_003773 [Lithospermum erythrorhizon]|nr:hypothetical protein Leryth_003773 [Lithospermum erythrorhizon]